MRELPKGLYQRGNAYYVRFINGTGERVRKSVGTSLEDALEAHQKLRREPGESVTLGHLLALQRENQLSYNKPSSVLSFDHSANQILRILGSDLDICGFSSQHLQKFVNRRRAEVKPISVNKDLRYLKVALRFAVELGFLEKLPVKIKMLRCPKKRDLPALSKDQIESLVNAAHGCFKLIIQLAAVTGMRLGEILLLRWEDILPEEERLVVRGENAKSHQHRSIPLSKKTLTGLIQYRETVYFSSDEDFVFHTRYGTPKNRNNVSHALQKIWKDAGLYRKGVTLHHLRHTAASEMLGAGVDIETVRECLGHSSITVTQLYCHTNEDRKRQALEKLSF